MKYHIGTQGWSYPDWVGPFYPEGTAAADLLPFYARAFSSVEVDSSFYAVPPASHFLGWDQRTPDGFRIALKLPGEITHQHRLRDGREVLSTFCKRAELLGEKLGAILVQLPPDFTPEERPSLEAFVARLPGHLPFAVEFRHPGWLSESVRHLLADAGICLALSEGPWIPREEVMAAAARPTADFAYIRWLGGRPRLSGYTHVQIDRATEIREWASLLRELEGRVREVFGFFNNHYEGHSPASARRLLERLGQPTPHPDQLNPQLKLL